jgi:hypothetical protein
MNSPSHFCECLRLAGIYQNLAHGARRDGFEVRQRGCGQMGRVLEFHPRFNLFLNKGQVAFHADMTQDGTIHDFSFVAGSGAPIENPFHRTLPGANGEDFPIVPAPGAIRARAHKLLIPV